MPCYVSPEEIAEYDKIIRERWEKEGRYDLLASKEQLAGWLCDAIRGEAASTEAVRWFIAHKKFNDSETV